MATPKRMNYGASSKQSLTPPHFRKMCVAIFYYFLFKGPKSAILDWKRSPPHLELFRKFVRFVRATRPYCRGHVWTTLLGSGHQGQGCLPLHQGGALGHNNLAKAMFFNAINFRSELMWPYQTLLFYIFNCWTKLHGGCKKYDVWVWPSSNRSP